MMITIKEAIAELMLHSFGRPCETKYGITTTCLHDCEKDKGTKCWQRFLSEDKDNGQDNT